MFLDNEYLYADEEIGHMTEESVVNPSSKKGMYVLYMLYVNIVKGGYACIYVCKHSQRRVCMYICM